MICNGAAAAAADGDEIVYENPMFIRAFRSGRVDRLFPDSTVSASLDAATGVNSKDCIINPTTGLSARIYLPHSGSTDKKLPITIYYHGGGFCVLSAFYAEYHNFLNNLAAKAKILVVSVEYRLAPEHPIPAAYEDSWEAIRWVAAGTEPWLAEHGNLEKIFLAGDSAGGNIVHNMGMKLGSEGMKVEGLVLLHPFFWGEERIGAEGEYRKGSIYSARDAEGIWRVACHGKLGFNDPRLNPLAEGAAALRTLGCKRALVCVAGLDFLRDRGRAYYDQLTNSSRWEGEAELAETEGEDHDFFLLNLGSEKAMEVVNWLVKFFQKEN